MAACDSLALLRASYARASLVIRSGLARGLRGGAGCDCGRGGRRPPGRGGRGEERPPGPRVLPGERDQLAQREHRGPGEFVAAVECRPGVERVGERLRDVADEYRLETRVRASQCHQRQPGLQAGEQVQERVVRPEHDRRPEDRPVEGARFAHRALAGCLRAQVHRRQRTRAARLHPQRRHVHLSLQHI